ncbi:MAG: hypothetical protein AWM53_00895 [Candidatus Dichloromethanomonas elyunquensis]|nr:MAG: hypothetical protein AWM53_00895 [Candidatus Dichloromethanomonas elyunquensis]
MDKKRDQGSMLILTMVVLTALLGIGALSTDMAVLYVEKSNLQNAADASALAGAQELPGKPQSAYSIADQYASSNHTALSAIKISSNNKEVLVTAQKEVPLYLARFFGISSKVVSAEARAAVLSAHSIKGVTPLSITMRDFVYGQEYTLKNAPPAGENGWYGPVRLDGQGASTYEESLADGCTSPLSIGQILEIENGNMSGPTKKGLENRLASDHRIPKNTFENHDSNAPEIVYIPIVEIAARDNSTVQEVKILGFAAFFIENLTQSGNDCWITGRFLQIIVSQGNETSPILAGEDDPTNDYGLYSVKLLMN